MPKREKISPQSRLFTLSVKPKWSDEKIEENLNLMKGVAEMYVVNHDRDQNEQGEMVEPHTHIFLIYSTPRKISTIANAFGLATNFVEVVRNKVAMLRYLTHLDQPTKASYDPKDVKTNSIEYADVIKGSTTTDRELIDAVLHGRDFDMIGIVPMARLRLAQSLVHNKRLANAEQLLTMMREQNNLLQAQVEKMNTSIDRIDGYFSQLVSNLTQVGNKAQEGIIKIAEEIKRARLRVK
jgi:hypothetical protein